MQKLSIRPCNHVAHASACDSTLSQMLHKLKHALQCAIFLLLSSLPFLSCNEEIISDYKLQLVVSSVIFEGGGIDSILVRRTLPIAEVYNRDSTFISGADVRITTGGKEFRLTEYPSKPGRYFLPKDSLIIHSRATYTLDVRALGLHAWGSTTVPDTIRLIKRIKDTLEYNERPLPVCTWTRAERRADYAIEILSLDSAATETPDTTGLRKEFRDSTNKSEYRNYIPNETLAIPWLPFIYYGATLIRIMAIDENFQTYFKLRINGGNVAQGNLTSIYGDGFGLFGSASQDTMRTFVKKKE